MISIKLLKIKLIFLLSFSLIFSSAYSGDKTLTATTAIAKFFNSSNIIKSKDWLNKIYSSSIAIIALNAVAPTDQLVTNLIGNTTLNVAGQLLTSSEPVQKKLDSASEKVKTAGKISPIIMGSVIV